MELFLKTAAGTVLAMVLILTVGKREKDIALVLGIVVCCMTGLVALGLLGPVVDLLYRMVEMAGVQEYGLGVLLKAIGIGLVSELVASLCADGGNSSLGRQVQLLGAVVILSLSVPLLEMLLELIGDLLGEL